MKLIEKPDVVLLQTSDFEVATRSSRKSSDICVNWSAQKTDLGMNFLNLENRNFEYLTWLMKNNMHQTNTNPVSLQRSFLSVLTSQMAVTHVQKQSPGAVLKKSCS